MSKHNHRRGDEDTRDHNAVKRGLGCCRSKRQIALSNRRYRRNVHKRERAVVRRLLDEGREPTPTTADVKTLRGSKTLHGMPRHDGAPGEKYNTWHEGRPLRHPTGPRRTVTRDADPDEEGK